MKTINVYQINEHPEPSKVYGWIRSNWYDLNSHSVNEVVASCAALAQHLGLTLDYSICAVPDQGEYIKFKNASGTVLTHGVNDSLLQGNCALTGVCWDEDLLDAFHQADDDDELSDVLENASQKVLTTLHGDTDHQYSDEGLKELCEENGYYFFECGSIAD